MFNHTTAPKLTLLSVAVFIKTADHPSPSYISLVFVPNVLSLKQIFSNIFQSLLYFRNLNM
jgi:hypothetical protein